MDIWYDVNNKRICGKKKIDNDVTFEQVQPSDKPVVESVIEPAAVNSILEQIVEHSGETQKIKAASESQVLRDLKARHREIGNWFK